MIPGPVEKARILTTSMVELNRLPKDCHPGSAVVAAMNAAIMGLCPGSSLGHCYFVPFREAKGTANEVRKVQLIVGYRGFVELGFASRWLQGVTPELVFEGERFTRRNGMSGPEFDHELDWEVRDAAERKGLSSVKLAYALWSSLQGHRDITVATGSHIRGIAKRQGNVWNSDPLPMALKTPVRRASKFWKQTHELADAVDLDERAERLAPQRNLALERGFVSASTQPALAVSDLAPQAKAREDEIRALVVERVTPLLPAGPPLSDDARNEISAVCRAIVNEHCSSMPEMDLVFFVADELLHSRKCSPLSQG